MCPTKILGCAMYAVGGRRVIFPGLSDTLETDELILGHTSIKTTIYSYPDTEELRAANQSLGTYVQPKNDKIFNAAIKK